MLSVQNDFEELLRFQVGFAVALSTSLVRAGLVKSDDLGDGLLAAATHEPPGSLAATMLSALAESLCARLEAPRDITH